MNAQQLFVAYTASMLDDEWAARIDDAIDALPETLDFCTPGDIGYMDGRDGNECDPLAYGYKTVAECEIYIVSWREGAHLEDTEDYADDIEDRDFWRNGQW